MCRVFWLCLGLKIGILGIMSIVVEIWLGCCRIYFLLGGYLRLFGFINYNLSY